MRIGETARGGASELADFLSPQFTFISSLLIHRSDQEQSLVPFLTTDVLLNTFHCLRC